MLAFNAELANVAALVSEPVLGQVRLQWWRDSIDQALAGDAPNSPVVAALSDGVQRFGFEPDLLHRLIDARELDLDPVPPPTMTALEAYGADTAGSVALLSLRALGCAELPTSVVARDVGTAWALAGILRSVIGQRSDRRAMLPFDLLQDAGLGAGDPFAAHQAEPLSAVVEAIRLRALDRLATARGHRKAVPRAALPALLPAGLADFYLQGMNRSGPPPRDRSPLRCQLRVMRSYLLRRY